jgi:hypothetical protein
MFTLVQINTDTYLDGVKRFRWSLGWIYVTHRYPPEVCIFVMRALTVSGLDPWPWERCITHLIRQPDSGFTQLLTNVRLGPVPASALPRAVELVRTYAQQYGKRLGEPPAAPTYMVEYGYNQPAYLEDLEQVYGLPLEPRYLAPWPATQESQPEAPPSFQPVLLQRAVAVMGATAGAIEQLLAIGATNEHRN